MSHPDTPALPGVRPKTRADCPPPDGQGRRVCPWVGCQYHLGVLSARRGRLKLHPALEETDPDLEALTNALSGSCCALDHAERGGITLQEIGGLFAVSRERIRQIETMGMEALQKAVARDPRLKAALEDLIDTDGGGVLRLTLAPKPPPPTPPPSTPAPRPRRRRTPRAPRGPAALHVRLRHAREQAGVSQRKLGASTGVPVSFIRHTEQGGVARRPRPGTPEQIRRWAEALGVEVLPGEIPEACAPRPRGDRPPQHPLRRKLKTARLAKDWSRGQLARALGVRCTQVLALEKDFHTPPHTRQSQARALKAARVLGVEVTHDDVKTFFVDVLQRAGLLDLLTHPPPDATTTTPHPESEPMPRDETHTPGPAPPPPLEPLGKRIRAARLARSWTQRTLAKKVRTSATTISTVEQHAQTGRGYYPESAAARIARFLDVPLGDDVEEEGGEGEDAEVEDEEEAAHDADATATSAGQIDEVEDDDQEEGDTPQVKPPARPGPLQRRIEEMEDRAMFYGADTPSITGLLVEPPPSVVEVRVLDAPLIQDPADLCVVALRRDTDGRKLLWALLQREHPGDVVLHHIAKKERVVVSQGEAARLSELVQGMHDQLELTGEPWDARPLAFHDVLQTFTSCDHTPPRSPAPP